MSKMNSKTFCLAPWVGTCVESTGKLVPCCNWSGVSDTNFRDFDSWINSDYLQDIRKRMYQGEKISQCDICWKDESVGKQSLRKIYNLEFSRFSNRDYINKNWQVTDSICALDLKLGNLCNLKCVMCTPSSSSQLLTEYKANVTKFNSLTGYSVNFLNKDFSWPLTDDFKKFLSKFQNQIKWIKFTGGEPTIIPHVLDVLDDIDCTSGVTVSFTTNATKLDQKFVDKIKKFGTVWLSVSLEGIEEHNDQIRFLSHWKEVEKNILSVYNLPNVYFSVNHVLQCFSVRTLIPLFQWCEKYQIPLRILKLSKPNYLSLDAVDANTINKFADRLKELNLTTNQNIVQQVLTYLQGHTYSENLEQQRHEYLQLIDSIRSTKTDQIIEEIE
jgi:MoaA/NifB/PqqE/SkfB family radical SAM enzyme